MDVAGSKALNNASASREGGERAGPGRNMFTFVPQLLVGLPQLLRVVRPVALLLLKGGE